MPSTRGRSLALSPSEYSKREDTCSVSSHSIPCTKYEWTSKLLENVVWCTRCMDQFVVIIYFLGVDIEEYIWLLPFCKFLLCYSYTSKSLFVYFLNLWESVELSSSIPLFIDFCVWFYSIPIYFLMNKHFLNFQCSSTSCIWFISKYWSSCFRSQHGILGGDDTETNGDHMFARH